VITYEKGAWIMHMLRRRLGDQPFLKFLAEMRRRHEFRSISTEDFRALIKEFLPPAVTPESIDTFFDNWVYSTGIPSLRVRSAVKGDAASWKLSGSVAQSGVDDDFAADVPLEIQFSKGAPQTIWVRTSGDATSFSATLRQPPLRVALAPVGVLAKK
jgi:aminopeptidase N